MNYNKPLDGMLMGTTSNDESNFSQKNNQQNVYFVKDEPVMRIVIDVIECLGKFGSVIIKARGDLIPNAVSISNILTEKMMRGSSRVEKIKLDSEVPKQLGRMISTIEIIVVKN